MKKLSKVLLAVIFAVMVFISNTFISVATQEKLILATTTSTENSGLLDRLIPPFEEKFGIKVDIIAVGTGKAIALAQNGDVDIILVHAREAEDKFVQRGYGVNRRDVMYNDFIVLGPEADPAGIKGMKDVKDAFQKIAGEQALFISRGDDSGTHKKELIIWENAQISPQGDWYLEVGQGMGASLNIADEKNAYILADRGTYLAYKKELNLKILVEGDPLLFNPYGIIPVNPELYPHVNYQLAMALVGFITSQEGQKIIMDYTVNGERLFYPLAIKQEKLEIK